MTRDEQIDFNALLFPGRKVLYVNEVAECLNVTTQHVKDLIEENQLGAINVGGSSRKFWRVPVSSFEAFLKSRDSRKQP